MTSFQIPDDLDRRLDWAARESGKYRSEIIREALEEWLNGFEDDNMPDIPPPPEDDDPPQQSLEESNAEFYRLAEEAGFGIGPPEEDDQGPAQHPL